MPSELRAPGSLATTELIALRVLSTAIRCREMDGGLVTYRRTNGEVVPGERLTVVVTKRWTWRHTDLVGGALLHHGFSLRALERAGYAHPQSSWAGVTCPSISDERLRDGLAQLEAGEWMGARCLLLDVLEDKPGSLFAHLALGDILSGLCHRGLALSHYTAAVRLGAGALDRETSLPLDASRPAERALLAALRGRALVFLSRGQQAAALADLRRALAWDPTDSVGAGQLLHELTTAAPAPGDVQDAAEAAKHGASAGLSPTPGSSRVGSEAG